MKIGYIRVSTVEQNEARQYVALKKYNIERYFHDKCSGKDTNRPKFQEMMDFAKKGDTIYVEDFSRLARSTEDLLRIVRELEEQGIGLVSMKENLDTDTPTGKLMLTMIAAVNEFERSNMLERQREGIALAKKRGVYTGKKKLPLPKGFSNYFHKWIRREMPKAAIAKELGVSRPTLDKFFKEYAEKYEKGAALA